MMPDIVNNDPRGVKSFTFSSWYVCGVNNPAKRGKLLSDLQTLVLDIIFLQETHLNNTSHGSMRTKCIGEIIILPSHLKQKVQPSYYEKA